MPRSRKLTDAQIRYIGESFADKGATVLSKELGVSRASIYRYKDEFAKTNQANRVPMGTEMGVTGLEVYAGRIANTDYSNVWDDLDSRLATVDEMKNHPLINALGSAIKQHAQTAEWTVVPGGDSDKDREARDFIASCLEDMTQSFSEHVFQAMEYPLYGFGIFEIVLKKRSGRKKKPESKYNDGRIGIKKLAVRNPKSLSWNEPWVFAEDGSLKGINQRDSNWYSKDADTFIPIERLIIYRIPDSFNSPEGVSLLRPVYTSWYMAKELSMMEAINAEKYGGLPVFYLGESTNKAGTNSDVAFARKAVESLRNHEQAGLVLPYPKLSGQDSSGILFELVTPSSGIVDFGPMVERHEQRIVQSLLGSFLFLGLSAAGTQSLAITLSRLWTQSVISVVTQMADSLNRYLIPRVMKFNTFGEDVAYPIIKAKVPSNLSIQEVLTAMSIGVNSGILEADEGLEHEVRRMLGIPQRDDQDAGKPLMEVHKKPVAPDKAPVPRAGSPIVETPETEGTRPARQFSIGTVPLSKSDSLKERLRKLYQNWGSSLSHFVAEQNSSMKMNENQLKAQAYKKQLASIDYNAPNAIWDMAEIMSNLRKDLDAEIPQVHVFNQIVPPAFNLPEIEFPPVNLHATIHQPDQIIETKEIVDRDTGGLINKTESRRKVENLP